MTAVTFIHVVYAHLDMTMKMPFGIMVSLEVMHSCLHCSMIHVSQERDSCSVMPESLIDGYQQLKKEILTSLFNG